MCCSTPLIALCLIIASPLHAQVIPEVLPDPVITLDAPITPPRIEFGAQGDITAFVGGDGLYLPGVGGRLTINVTALDALEIGLDIVPAIEDGGLWGFYAIQYKRVVRQGSRRRNAIFATVTSGGLFRYNRYQEYAEHRPDGSTFVRPSYRYGEVTRPVLFGGGVGAEAVVARYAAIRADVQGFVGPDAIPGFRGTAGITIPVGGYDGFRR